MATNNLVPQVLYMVVMALNSTPHACGRGNAWALTMVLCLDRLGVQGRKPPEALVNRLHDKKGNVDIQKRTGAESELVSLA